MAQPAREKRAFRRVPVSLTAHCRIGNRFVREPIADLSRGGLYLRTKEPTKEGIPVRVAVALPGDDGPRFCTLVGHVARLDRDGRGRIVGIGVSFVEDEIGKKDREALEAFLEAAGGRNLSCSDPREGTTRSPSTGRGGASTGSA